MLKIALKGAVNMILELNSNNILIKVRIDNNLKIINLMDCGMGASGTKIIVDALIQNDN